MKHLISVFLILTVGCTIDRPVEINPVNNIEDYWLEENAAEMVNEKYKINGKKYNILLISGGGTNGVYAVGVVNGLAEANKLPKFDTVTGVSTGGMMATHVFLGNKNSLKELKQEYLSLTPKSLLSYYHVKEIPWSNAVSNNDKLKEIIKRNLPDSKIDKVAEEYTKYRRKIYIGTTSLDDGRNRIWAMHHIAVDKRYNLYRRVVLASASVPGLFPPEFINDNMYADGAVTDNLCFDESLLPRPNTGVRLWIIYNDMLEQYPDKIKNKFSTIVIRALSTVAKSGQLNQLKYILAFANKRDIQIVQFLWPKEIWTIGFKPSKQDLKKIYDKGYEIGYNYDNSRHIGYSRQD